MRNPLSLPVKTRDLTTKFRRTFHSFDYRSRTCTLFQSLRKQFRVLLPANHDQGLCLVSVRSTCIFLGLTFHRFSLRRLCQYFSKNSNRQYVQLLQSIGNDCYNSAGLWWSLYNASLSCISLTSNLRQLHMARDLYGEKGVYGTALYIELLRNQVLIHAGVRESQ